MVNVHGKGPQTVVLRVLRPSLYRTPDTMSNNRVVKTFLAEIFYNTYLTSQNVRNVVKIFDYGNLHNKHYFTMMDYVDGPNFSDLIKRGPKDVKELMRRIIFINAVAGVVGELHFRGIIHRDLKPSNIIVQGWEPFLSDLGRRALDARQGRRGRRAADRAGHALRTCPMSSWTGISTRWITAPTSSPWGPWPPTPSPGCILSPSARRSITAKRAFPRFPAWSRKSRKSPSAKGKCCGKP